MMIETPGVYDLPNDEYHADPVPVGSLSSSGARLLLPPSCPAQFAYQQKHPPTPKPEYDLGHAAHLHVLGTGPELVVLDAENWRTKGAREARDEAYAAGKVPLLTADHDRVVSMAAALRQHPMAGDLFRPGQGWAERSLFWVDADTEVWCRARLDWLRSAGRGRTIVVDYKTARSAAPDDIQWAIYAYGYHQQGAWYVDAVRALELGDDPQFVLVIQEKDPPYLVTVAQPDTVALRIGGRLNREALDIYRECVAAGRWPGYSDDDVKVIPLPAYVENRYTEETYR